MFEQKCFCAQYKGPELFKSTSGGVFFAFAKYIIEKRGCACGAAFDQNLVLKHCCVDNLEGLHMLQGSKYVESNFVHILPEIKKKLEEGLLVLFSGTPCQVAAVRSHFKEKYSNLLLIDILCHGTPDYNLFKKYIEWREFKWKAKILSFEFRNKMVSPWGGIPKAYVKTTKGEKIIPAICDPYYWAFLNGHLAKKKCYSCRYASVNRVGDITAADFWGCHEFFPNFPYKKGASCILVNSEKGMKYFNAIKDQFFLKEASIDLAKKYNYQFSRPLVFSIQQEKIYSMIKDTSDFSSVLPFCGHRSMFFYYYSKLKSIFSVIYLKRILKKVLTKLKRKNENRNSYSRTL